MSADINVGALSEAINNKADRDIGNLTTPGYDKASGLGMPSDRYIDLTLGASGTTYTAPANGYISYAGSFSASGRVHFTSSNIQDSRYTLAGEWCGATIPIKKGDSFAFYYNGTANLSLFRFVYTEGAE